MSSPDPIAALVCERLEEKGKSIRWLARVASVGYGNLHGWLRGTKDVKVATACRVLAVLELSVTPQAPRTSGEGRSQ